MNGLALVLAVAAVASVGAQEFGRPVGPVPIPARSPEQLTRVTGASSDCALIVAGPPRSSQFGAAVDAFGGVGSVDLAGSTCITYDAVNAAFAQARGQVGLPPVRGAFTTQDVANLGTVIQETSRFLARQFGLSKDAIANGLPQIDAARTDIQPFCPPFLMTPKCDVTRYRSISGFCNNLENPHWGASMHGYSRFLAPDFADGISAPRVSVTGQELPSPRLVWTQAHSTETKHDHAISTYLVAWGQFIDHEFTFAAEVREADGRSPKCCDGSKNPQCLPITIPDQDGFYGKFGQRCMNFVRNQPGLRHNCRLGPRNGFNHVSSFLDGGGTYSNEEARLQTLREFRGGRLNMLPMFDRFQMKRLLPVQLDRPDDGCIRPSQDVFCFESGDQRVNEQTILAMTHTLFAREHNRIADELAAINPHWNDETIFQETKHIVTALEQQITYNEFLPMVLGRDLMQQHNLILLKDGYLEGYDPKMNPSVATVVAVAAFRFGHSLLPNGIERWSTSHQFIGNQELHSMLNQPYDLYKEGWADEYLMGMANQVAQAMDLAVTSEVANHLFQEPGKPFGRDLATINIQRGREQGIPGYNAWRAWCGLSTFPTFDDMVGHVDNETINGYKQVYSAPDDVDLWSAGISETPMPGAMIGPTFGCIIGKQFHNFRFGDRFWYENGGWPSSFTVEQLNEIRKVKFSRIICDNGDAIQSMQVWAFVLPDHDINPRVPCGSGVLKRMDLTKWRDASFHPNP